MNIWIATVDHKHGTNAYAARTEAGATAKLASFCREWWAEISDDEEPPAGMSDDDIVATYFTAQDAFDEPETYTLMETTIEDDDTAVFRERAIRDLLNAYDDGPQFCTGTESSGRLVWKGSFITFMERVRHYFQTTVIDCLNRATQKRTVITRNQRRPRT